MAPNIETKEQYADTPEGWAERWSVELASARKELERWHERGRKVEKRYLDERDGDASEARLNLFHGDVETKKALLYGNPPRVRARRRFADADDDVARVSAEALERMLNSDIERDSDGFRSAIALARDDRLIPGLGVIWMRYTVEMGETPETPARIDSKTGAELAPAVPAQPTKAHEDVETDYVRWEDVLWGVSRYWSEVPWIARRAYMTREALVERFGEAGRLVPLNAGKRRDERREDPWSRAEVWEIWSKQDRRVYWYVEGFGRTLDIKDDPLGLGGFWPCPRPLFGNVTTARLVPLPDFYLAQDQYDEIDVTTTRIKLLTEALRVAGIYDKTQPALGRLLNAAENTMIPVDGWAALAEKGGIKGVVDFFPLDMVIATLERLTLVRREQIALKDQATGIGDIMRGQSTPGGATATEQRIKARATSARVQAAQDEFAAFVTEAQRIRAEIISKHYDDQTIIERSNLMRTADAALAQQAVALLKSEIGAYRIEVAADALAQTDFDAVKQESTEFLTAVSGFLGSVQQIGAASPAAVPYLLELLKAGVSGFRRAATLEGILDKAITAANQAASAPKQPPPPDPKVEAERVRAGAEQFKAKADMAQTAMDLRAKQEEHAMDMQKMQAQAVVAASQPLRQVFTPAPGEEQ